MRVRQPGFTIVELLIVVVVIGILAAIVIVAYNGITNSAHESTIKNDLATFAKKLEIYRIENGSYPAQVASQLAAANLKATKESYQGRNNIYYCSSNDGQHYSIGVYAITTTRYWLIDGTVSTTTDNIYGESNCNNLPGGSDAVGTGPDEHPQYSSVGYDWPGDGNGNGWAAWME